MITTVRGVRDILPDETLVWQFLEKQAAEIFAQYGYHEIRTPIFEKTELFARAVGTTSDIVEKEMYTFADRSGDSVSLRPEGTAAVVRVFIENSLHRHLPWKVWYQGPMFRYERPQKGRQRQFHQIGCELFGPEGPMADAEMMAMVMRLFDRLGISTQLRLEINSLGCSQCRDPYRAQLIADFEQKKAVLCADCQLRLSRNPMRILDCKQAVCKEVAQQAPHMKDHLCSACAEHFQGLVQHLDNLGLPYRLNPLMVRGLDYYNRTAFEVTTDALGAQNAVAAGGRYDGLVREMGGTATKAIGFAMGLERLVLLLAAEQTKTPVADIYLVTVGQAAEKSGLKLAESFRAVGLKVDSLLSGGSMKSQMKHAGRSQVGLTAIIGDREVADHTVVIKNMSQGEQTIVGQDDAAQYAQAILKLK